ncbi:MAG: hypothetical protein J0I70_11585 [Microbacterium sp.]|uniref:hypothetical protein n=1 Tax=Microbacterium sp. TaxID=51671 RepID=UPI001AD2D1C0|nr:hypothetical protein [Microbacterium sp.]MBN9174778.1 hypothetical protein [Microbacterium sp.]
MHAMLTPVRSLHQDRHFDVDALDARTRLSLVDRISLRIGLRLMLRAERIVARRRDHDARDLALANARTLRARERDVENAALIPLFR